MMIRMKQEISRLQSELNAMEHTKNSEFQGVLNLQKQIFERERQFLVSRVHTNITNSMKDEKDCRRRTWCPTSNVAVFKTQIPQLQGN